MDSSSGEIMMIKELLKKSRSYRGYDESRRISKDELLEFVDCARFAPSSVNRQPLRYDLVYEKSEVDAFLPLTHWARGLPDLKLPHPGKAPTAYIVICQETEWDADVHRYLKDVGIVAQTMLLAATENGLGGIMIGNFVPSQVSELRKLPDHLVPLLIVAFGKPDETIILTEIENGESVKYYRDDLDRHYVPKRKLKDIII